MYCELYSEAINQAYRIPFSSGMIQNVKITWIEKLTTYNYVFENLRCISSSIYPMMGQLFYSLNCSEDFELLVLYRTWFGISLCRAWILWRWSWRRSRRSYTPPPGLSVAAHSKSGRRGLRRKQHRNVESTDPFCTSCFKCLTLSQHIHWSFGPFSAYSLIYDLTWGGQCTYSLVYNIIWTTTRRNHHN
jgi:hypothetical protein